MKGKNLFDHPVPALVPGALVLAALAVAAGSERLAPEGIFPAVWEMAGLAAAGTLAALHRPFPGTAKAGPAATPGLAALVLPAALALGAVPAALVAALVSVSAAAVRSLAGRRTGERDEGGPVRIVEHALFAAGAVLLAGAVAGRTSSSAAGWLSPALAYLAGFAALLAVRWLVFVKDRPRGRHQWGRRSLVLVSPLSLDAAGWTIGALLHEVAARGSGKTAAALMAAVAILAAEAARNAWLKKEAEARVADLERLQRAHERILAEVSGMGGIAQQILTEVRNILPVQWFQFEQNLPDGTRRSWAAGPDSVLFEGEPEPEVRPRALPGVHKRASWRVLEKELRAEDETLAVVRLWCDPRRIETDAEELFATLVPQMASSVHRARLDREAKIDPLTGVPVRRMLESSLQRAYRLCLEEGWSMAVILSDIDHFKKINDTYGHAAGDEALRLFAKTLDTHRRENDLCCRYGGEEFTLLLENTSGEAALALAERLRQAVETLRFEYEGELIPITFSAGVAAFPELHIKTASELLLLADEALYQAKDQGRNRCLLNLGRGAYRAPAGRTVYTRGEPAPSATPRFFG